MSFRFTNYNFMLKCLAAITAATTIALSAWGISSFAAVPTMVAASVYTPIAAGTFLLGIIGLCCLLTLFGGNSLTRNYHPLERTYHSYPSGIYVSGFVPSARTAHVHGSPRPTHTHGSQGHMHVHGTPGQAAFFHTARSHFPTPQTTHVHSAHAPTAHVHVR